MAELDETSLVGSELEQLEQDVLASARDDVPPKEARDQVLAALSLPASTASAGRASPWGGAGARVAQVIGLALAVGAASVAVVGLSGDDAEAVPTSEAAAVAPRVPVTTPETAPEAMPETVSTIAAPAVVASPRPPQEAAPGESTPTEETTDIAAPNRPAPAPRGARPVQHTPAADAPAELGARAPTTRSSAPAARVESTLGRELARVTAARSAIAGGEAARALGELDAYDAEFPAGAFSVEVAVLRIEALARSGRGDEARRLGDRFLAQHPQGLFARRVTTTLRSVGPAPEDPPTPAR
ncbi:MAG: hypothetical protein KF894_16735 [Labilithrix sp.]|nr:hypothetical protein [Labilithrix sp.]